jgi:hypothetical protein
MMARDREQEQMKRFEKRRRRATSITLRPGDARGGRRPKPDSPDEGLAIPGRKAQA